MSLLESSPSVNGEELPLAQWPDYAHARAMHPDELWFEPNNGGNDQDAEYIAVYTAARQTLVDMFHSGRLYESTDSFTECLTELHYAIGSSGVYQRLGNRKLTPDQCGKLDDRYGRFSNTRNSLALAVAQVAHRYEDPYGTDDRLVRGYPNSTSVRILQLPGVTKTNLPYDTVRYGDDGTILPTSREHWPTYDESGYTYTYPDVKGVDEYLDLARLLGTHIDRQIKSGDGDTYTVLALIAKQYQYLACARPFAQINNSLFMQLANMQVKLLGLRGMTHGIMDVAAHRMQPDNFAHYFAARALSIEP